MLKYVLLSLVVFLFSSIWLSVVLSYDWTTYSWEPVVAEIGVAETRRGRLRRRFPRSPVSYEVDGVLYERYVDDMLIPGTGTVYVNPDDPADAVGVPGPNLLHFGPPLIVTSASGLFLVVLGLIAFSPKED